MLGIFRYILALMVTLSHLWTGLAGWSGVGAVFGFYVISGYLMTSVLNQSYGFTPQGLGRYALNRFLRIFPTYWFVLLFAVIVVATIPSGAGWPAPSLTRRAGIGSDRLRGWAGCRAKTRANRSRTRRAIGLL